MQYLVLAKTQIMQEMFSKCQQLHQKSWVIINWDDSGLPCNSIHVHDVSWDARTGVPAVGDVGDVRYIVRFSQHWGRESGLSDNKAMFRLKEDGKKLSDILIGWPVKISLFIKFSNLWSVFHLFQSKSLPYLY